MADNDEAKTGELSAQAAADLLRRERRQTRWTGRLGTTLPAAVWGVAWLVGFLALWSDSAEGGNPWFRLDHGAATGIFGIALAAAALLSIAIGIAARRGLRGPSAARDRLHGWAWSLAMTTTGITSLILVQSGAIPGVAWLLVPTLFAVVAGALMAAGGALLRSVPRFVLGVVLLVLGVLGAWVGAPDLFLLYALGGGLALIGYAAWVRVDAGSDRDERTE